MPINKKTSVFIVLFSLFLISMNPALAVVFDPNNIISDDEMLDSNSMSLHDIEVFLSSKGGYIASQTFTDAFGNNKTAAQIIYDAANNYECEKMEDYRKWTLAEKQQNCKPARINPKLILVLLQKEQSLLDHPNPSQKKLDWAAGYAVCDNCSMDDSGIQRFKGFGKQVNSAALQFYDYMANPQNYKYQPGNTYVISNTNRPDTVVTPANRATAALYNYTPHTYNGNFNFFKLWISYFSQSYPNGTLMQVKGQTGVWLIQDGKRRPFLSKGALTSRFDTDKIIYVSKNDLEKYPIGNPIKFPQYSVVRSPKGNIYLLIDDQRRGFTSKEAVRITGINPEEIIPASWEDINFYKEIAPITASSSNPTGALMQDSKTGGIFYVSEGTKAPLWDSIFLKTKFKFKAITKVSQQKLASYKTIAPVMFGDGELLKDKNSKAVYVIDNGQKRVFTSGEVFEKLGYQWKNLIPVSQKILNLYPDGEAIVEAYASDSITILDATTTPPMLNLNASTTPIAVPLTSSSSIDVSQITTPKSGSSSPLIGSSSTIISQDSALSEEIKSVLNP